MSRPTRAVLLVLLLAGLATAARAAPSPAEARLLELANVARAAEGAPPLAWNEHLADVARAHAVDLRARGGLSHDSLLDGATLADRVGRAGLRVTRCAENVGRAPDADAAHAALMDSPGHRANLLDPGLTEAGFGVVEDEGGAWVVQDFAVAAPDWDPERASREVARVLLAPPPDGRAWALREDGDLSRVMQAAAESMAARDACFASAETHGGCWMLAYAAADPRDVPRDRVPDCAATRAGVGAAWARTASRPLGAWFVAIALAP